MLKTIKKTFNDLVFYYYRNSLKLLVFYVAANVCMLGDAFVCRLIEHLLRSHGDHKPVWFLVSFGTKIDMFHLRQRLGTPMSLSVSKMREISQYSWNPKWMAATLILHQA